MRRTKHDPSIFDRAQCRTGRRVTKPRIPRRILAGTERVLIRHPQTHVKAIGAERPITPPNPES